MKFKLLLTSGSLDVTTEGPEDRVLLAKYGPGDELKRAQLMVGDDFSLQLPGPKNRWARGSGVVPEEFLTPFLEEVRKVTGHSDWVPSPDKDLLPVWEQARHSVVPLSYSVAVEKAVLREGLSVFVSGYQRTYGKNTQQEAQVDALTRFNSWLKEQFGKVWTPQEYWSRGNIYYRNKWYGKGIKVVLPFNRFPEDNEKHLSSYGERRRHWFLAYLFRKWEEDRATAEQKLVLEAWRELCTESGLDKYSRGWWEDFYLYAKPVTCLIEQGIGKLIDYWSKGDGKAMLLTNEEFVKIGKGKQDES